MPNKYAYYHSLTAKTKVLNRIRKLFQFGPFERILATMTRGRGSREFVSRFVPPEYLYPNPSWRTCEVNGIRYRLDISKKVDHHLFYGFKIHGIQILLDELTDTSVIIDIGANIGATGLLFAQKSEAGFVYCFEPVSETFQRLKENFALNSFKNYSLINKGLGDKKETLTIGNVVASNPGMNRIISNHNPDIEPIERIEVSTLDDEIESLELNSLDVIKIDVEGFEFHVLKGAEHSLRKFSPILFIELGDRNLKEQGASASAVYEFLVDLNYTIYRDEHGVRTKIERSSEVIDAHYDILCTPSSN